MNPFEAGLILSGWSALLIIVLGITVSRYMRRLSRKVADLQASQAIINQHMLQVSIELDRVGVECSRFKSYIETQHISKATKDVIATTTVDKRCGTCKHFTEEATCAITLIDAKALNGKDCTIWEAK